MKKNISDAMIASYDDWSDDYIYDHYLAEIHYQDVSEIADTVLDSKVYVHVDGFSQRWNGSSGVDMIIPETTLGDIISKYINPDRIVIEVYEDRVELSNCHHDGTNRYTFTPMDLYDLTNKELKDMIADEQDFKEYMDVSLSRATKNNLVEYIEDNDILEGR
jgi:hypothetical protein